MRRRQSARPEVQAIFAAAKAARSIRPPNDANFPGTVATVLRLSGSENSEPYSAHESVYRCVSVIARNLSQIPLQVRRDRKGAAKVIESGPWYDLLLNPNPLQTRREFVEATLTLWLLDGLAYWAMEGRGGARLGKGDIPARMNARARADVKPLITEGGDLAGWEVRDPVTREIRTFPAHAVIPFRFFDPRDPWGGQTPLAAASRGYRVDLKAQRFTDALYENAADPGGVLETDQNLGSVVRGELRKEWEDRHRGPDKVGKIAVLEGGLKYRQTPANMKDLAYIETRKLSRQQVATVYGVPLFFLMEASETSYAGTRSAVRTLWENTLLPLKVMVEDVAEARLFRYVDSSLYLEFDTTGVEALRDDLSTRLDAAEKMQRLGVPRDKALAAVNVPIDPDEGSDVALIAQALAPLARVAAGETMAGGEGLGGLAGEPGAPGTNPDALPQTDKAPIPPKGGPNPLPTPGASGGSGGGSATPAADAAAAGVNPAQTAYNGAQVAAMVDTVKAVVAKELPPASAEAILLAGFPLTPAQAKAIVAPAATLAEEKEAEAPLPGAGVGPDGKPIPAIEPKPDPNPPAGDAKPPRTREADPRWVRVFRGVMGPAEARYRKRFTGWLWGRRAEALAALDRFARSESIETAGWEEWLKAARARWAESLSKQMKPLYRQTMEAAAKDLATDLKSGALQVFNMERPEVLEFLSRKDVLLRGVSDRIVENVRESVAEALGNGANVREVQDAVRGTFDTTRSRSLAVARTETAQSVNGARHLAMKAEGVTKTEWLTQGFGVRDEHEPLDGKTVPIDGTFVEGITLRHPGDLAAPARYVVNCRCSALPVD